jgi:hypothetical protein
MMEEYMYVKSELSETSDSTELNLFLPEPVDLVRQL